MHPIITKAPYQPAAQLRLDQGSRDAGDLGRSISRNGGGCGGGGLCLGASASGQRHSVVVAGPAIPAGHRTPLPCGDGDHARPFVSGIESAQGCALGDGGRAALPVAGRGDCRGLGQSCRAGLHRHQTAGVAVRGAQCPRLADPAGGHGRPECGAGTLAHRIAPFGHGPRRHAGPGGTDVAGRSVPGPLADPGAMGGPL